ncbi:MAG: hypothetical protein Kow0032_11820 [Methyloligellaceae bacterium]|nr:MAG: hypothetical protein D6773_18130 [Alphaproteobacteria bacterium]
MDVIYFIFAAATGIAALLASIAIWAPRDTLIRALALAVMALFMPLVYVQFTGLLAKPKPVSFAWLERGIERAEVLSVSFDEGKAIYMWVRLDGMIEPRFYSLPWRQNIAEDLEDAVDQATRTRSSLIVRDLFSKRSLEERGGVSVEIIPPPTPPLKKPVVPPRVFNPRSPEI